MVCLIIIALILLKQSAKDHRACNEQEVCADYNQDYRNEEQCKC